MAYRFWDEDELAILEEKADELTTEGLAKKLGRSRHAVALKRYRSGIGGLRDSTDMITRKALAELLGVDWRTVKVWTEKRGLRSMRKGSFIMYRQAKVVKWLFENQDLWNASRVTDTTIFQGAEWFKEKRKKDKPTKYNWTTDEVQKLKFLRHQGYTLREIAEKLGRSESSIKYKLYYGLEDPKWT